MSFCFTTFGNTVHLTAAFSRSIMIKYILNILIDLWTRFMKNLELHHFFLAGQNSKDYTQCPSVNLLLILIKSNIISSSSMYVSFFENKNKKMIWGCIWVTVCM